MLLISPSEEGTLEHEIKHPKLEKTVYEFNHVGVNEVYRSVRVLCMVKKLIEVSTKNKWARVQRIYLKQV